ncbi:HAMP domain-containing histidine kinase [Candidatus Woesearchaeota archaeon]|nr:HAMP domain-containing histidine kinase [Candidatus Woesearchaeota archaeon]
MIVRFSKSMKISKINFTWKLLTLLFSLLITALTIIASIALRDELINDKIGALISICFLASILALVGFRKMFSEMDDYTDKKERLLKLNFMLDTHAQKKADEYSDKADELKIKNERLAMQAEMLAKQQKELKMFNEELKNTQEELKEEKKSVEKKVKERTKQLRVEKEVVENLLTQKTQFINQLSHDLRTPLTPLLNLLPYLEHHIKGKEEKKILEICIKNSNYLERLVLDTLSLARMEAKTAKLDLKKVKLVNLADEIIRSIHMAYKKDTVRISNNITKGLKAEIDELKLREVFENIITNAIKYNESDVKKIDITSKTKEKFFEINFKDNGIGLEAKDLNSIFNEFYKADPSRHHHESSGLGLSIAKRIVELHDGQIFALSDGKDKGTTITIKLPIGRKK